MDFLAARGVRHVFMLPGGGCMHLVDSLGRNRSLEHVSCLHEQAAAIAAEAYAQYTNSVGVALVTTGPGGTNAVTGVAAAWVDSTPCMVISGQVKRPDLMAGRGVRQMGMQEVDIVSIIRPITKYAVTVTEPRAIRYHLERAFHMALSGRPGPVWLDIPLDVQAAEVDVNSLEGFGPPAAGTPSPALLDGQVRGLIEILWRSQRPVILAGNGLRLAGAVEEFVALVERLGIPLLTTWKAADFVPEDHPLYCGRPGSIGQRGANFALQNADCLVAVGARLDVAQVGYSHQQLARGAAKVVVDVDERELQKFSPPVELPICADARSFVRALAQQTAGEPRQEWGAWLARCKEWQRKYPVITAAHWEDTGYVNTYALVDVLSDLLGEQDLLVPGSSGACSEITFQAFRVRKGQRVLNNQGLGSMGFGLPASIGACLASGRRRTVCINGDGGFQLNIQELETVSRLQLPIKFFVLNNQGYASIRAAQRSYFEGRYVGSDASSGLTLPDIAAVARAYGLRAVAISDHSQLRQQVADVLASHGPVVCEVLTAPDQATAPRLSSVQREDGSMVSRPLEDLWPFLDRDELRENMLIPLLDES
jgi:acetolactate synthase-1/2/3 large subunit